LSSIAAAMRTFLWIEALSFRVFASGAIYRRKGEVGGCSGGLHHSQARPGGPRLGMV
jgi:hypothetical protein